MQWALLPLRRYADFEGRSRRMEFWSFSLLNFVVALVLAGPAYFSILTAAFSASDPGLYGAEANPFAGIGVISMILLGIYFLYALAILVPSIAVAVRRLHDRDMSGWWYLGAVVASAIPFIGIFASLALVVIFFLPGTPGPNRFGPDPKDPSSSEVFA